MRKTLAIAALGLAALRSDGAEAAQIVLYTDKATYLIGETITLTVAAAFDGTETDNGITGVVLFDTALVSPTAGGATQTPLTSIGGAITWTQGALTTFCTDASGSCRMFSQVSPVGAQSVSSPASPFVLSTKTFTYDALGFATFTWLVSPMTPVAQRLDFFGVTSAPGVTIRTGDEIPEPSTAALILIGLLGLAATRRPRS